MIYSLLGPAFTLERQGRILACGGVVLTSTTEGRGWAVVSREAARIPVALTRTVREILDRLEIAGLDRVTILVKKQHPTAARRAGLLGFRPIPNGGENLGSTPHLIFERRKPCPGTSD